MQKHKLTQKALAETTGLTQAAISLYVKGESTPKSSELQGLADEFGVTMDELWRGSAFGEDKKEEYWERRAKAAEAKIRKLVPACRSLADGAKKLTDILSE